MTPACIVLALACAASIAGAADHPEEARKLSLKERKGRQSLSWTVRVPPPVAPSASPIAVGATLELRTQGGESASFDLPASGWTADESGQTFRFKNPESSAIKTVTLRNQRLIKARGRQTGVTLDEASQGAMTIALVIGDDVYCSTCMAPRHDEPGRFVATRCSAPADCSLTTTTTTTTTSTTTSTFVPGVCGNGVVDQSSEQCDAPDPGLCDDPTLEVPVDCGAPTSSTPCQCCGTTRCAISLSFVLPCCGPSQCQDTSGVGMSRSGVCIPPSCTQSSDCNGAGYECVGGSCCAQAGNLCGVVDCCPGSNATCTFGVGPDTPLCCRSPGAACSAPQECCSFSCVDGLCY